MARQRTYQNDNVVTGSDRLTGVDFADNSTKNFTIEAIAQLFASTGIADPARLSYFYTITSNRSANAQGQAYLSFDSETRSNLFTAVNQIVVNQYDSSGRGDTNQGSNIVPLTRFMVGNDVQITSVQNAGDTNYGIFQVTSISRSPDGRQVTLNLQHRASNGNPPQGDISLSVLSAAISTEVRGSAIFDGNYVPSPNNPPAEDGDVFLRRYDVANQTLVDIYIFSSGGWGSPTTLTGEQGPQGPHGPQGDRGPMGNVGPRGPQGNPGPASTTQGPAGAPGRDGSPGPRGDSITQLVSQPSGDNTEVFIGTQDDPVTGTQGSYTGGLGNFVVNRGPQGVAGNQGDPGDDGDAGPQGDQGLSRIELYAPSTTTAIPATFDIQIETIDFDYVASSIPSPFVDSFNATTHPNVTFAIVDPSQFTDRDSGTTYTIPRAAWATPYNASTQGATGPTGPVGPSGMQGERGPQGRGVTSITNPDGDRNAIVTYTNPADGSTSTGNLLLPLGPQGPRGEEGPEGDQGNPGTPGQPGPQGQPGQTGPQGIQGVPGDTGATGPQGAFEIVLFERFVQGQAPTTAPSATTYRPDNGTLTRPSGWELSPPSGTNPLYSIQAFINPVTAVNGIVPATWSIPVLASETGTQGPQGPPGNNGSNGNAATIAVNPTTITGAAGTNATVTNTGDSTNAVFQFTIPRGNQGNPGADGQPGPRGPQGNTGPQGNQGPQGPQGPPGVHGEQGDQGNPGTQGITGDSVTVGTVRNGSSPGQTSEFDLQEVNHLGQNVGSPDTVIVQPGNPGEIVVGANTYSRITLSDAGNVDFTDSSGTISANANIPLATQSVDGLMSSTDKTKLDQSNVSGQRVTIGTDGVTVPTTALELTDITSVGSGQIITAAERNIVDDITNTGSGAIITTTERTKLTGIEERATRGVSVQDGGGTPIRDVTTIRFDAGHFDVVDLGGGTVEIDLTGSSPSTGRSFTGTLAVTNPIPDNNTAGVKTVMFTPSWTVQTGATVTSATITGHGVNLDVTSANGVQTAATNVTFALDTPLSFTLTLVGEDSNSHPTTRTFQSNAVEVRRALGDMLIGLTTDTAVSTLTETDINAFTDTGAVAPTGLQTVATSGTPSNDTYVWIVADQSVTVTRYLEGGVFNEPVIGPFNLVGPALASYPGYRAYRSTTTHPDIGSNDYQIIIETS